MADIKWIKITTDLFEDEKIKMIDSLPESDAVLVIWLKLLTLAGKKNEGGSIAFTENVPYSDEMLSTVFNRPLNTVRLALQTFQQFEMIEISSDDFIYISNWEKHQNIEGMDKIREQNRLRQQKRRSKMKLLQENNVTSRDSNALDKEEDKEEDKKKNIHGEFVKLTEPEYQKLIKKFGKERAEEKIKDLDTGIGSKGYKYKSHYHTILSWDRKEKKEAKANTQSTHTYQEL